MSRTILVFTLYCISLTSYSQIKPNWVSDHPLDREYYVGIAFCEKSNPNYIECAKSKALEGIASEIMITVSSENQLITTEFNDTFESSFSSNIKTKTTSELEGYELIDIWQDNRFYWVYYRLKKETYSILLNNKVLSEFNIAQQFFDNGLKHLINKDFAISLSSFIQANIIIQSNLSRPYVSEYSLNSWQIFEQSKKQIIDLLSRINLLTDTNEISISYINPNIATLKAQVAYIDENNLQTPILNMPCKFTFEKGNGIISDTIVYSNNIGIITNKLIRINSPELKQILVCDIYIEKLIPDHKNNMVLIQNILSGNVPKTRFNINVEKALVYINTIELNQNKVINSKIIEPALINYLKNNGFIISTNSQNYEYRVIINANTRKGNQLNGIYTSFLDVEILLQDKYNNIIFSDSKNGLKGLKLNFNDAGLDSYNRNIKMIENEFFGDMILKLLQE